MAKTATASATDIIETWRADGIRYVRFELPDMHGTSRSKIVPIDQASGYCEEGLNMYGGAAVLDSRSDVVPDTLYHEEIGYGDQRLIPDPETAAVVPWAEATARFICDSQFIGGEPLRALAALRLPPPARALPRPRLRARARVRARVLSPATRTARRSSRATRSSTPSGTRTSR